MSRSRRFIVLSLALPLACCGAAWGQETSTQFNLTTPGARSLGMGGAFLALADDSTAAYTNPAGLTNLRVGGPEVAAEFRSWGYSTPFIEEGRLDGTALRIGLDAASGLIIPEAESKLADISYFSIGYVLPRGFTVALYRHQLANYSTGFASQGFFYHDNDQPFSTGRQFPQVYVSDIKIQGWGASAAYEFSRPLGGAWDLPLSLGISVTRLQVNSLSANLFFTPRRSDVMSDPVNSAPDGFFGRSQFLPANLTEKGEETGADTALGWNAGLLWKLGAKNQWHVAGVYRKGPKFLTDRLFQSLNNDDVPSQGTLKVPDVYGIGVAYSSPRSEGKTKLAVDYQKVLYSQRLGDFFFQGKVQEGYDVADAGELHLGMERVLLTRGALVGTARLGAWREPAHELKYSGTSPQLRSLYPGGSDQNHWAGGLGLVVGEEYQVDIAYDRSETVKTLSFSVVRFF